eukprot:1719108-Ditylum_brightwellii.AAC.2
MEFKTKGRPHAGKLPSTIQRCTKSAKENRCTNGTRRHEPGTDGEHDCRRYPAGNQPEGSKEDSEQTVNMVKSVEKSLQQELAKMGETLQAMQKSHSQLQQQHPGQEN